MQITQFPWDLARYEIYVTLACIFDWKILGLSTLTGETL